jgi:hypothetical protein
VCVCFIRPAEFELKVPDAALNRNLPVNAQAPTKKSEPSHTGGSFYMFDDENSSPVTAEPPPSTSRSQSQTHTYRESDRQNHNNTSQSSANRPKKRVRVGADSFGEYFEER